jgi:hypothetical protein
MTEIVDNRISKSRIGVSFGIVGRVAWIKVQEDNARGLRIPNKRFWYRLDVDLRRDRSLRVEEIDAVSVDLKNVRAFRWKRQPRIFHQDPILAFILSPGGIFVTPSMQNRYAGDVGDFGKLGLLRCLSADNDGEGAFRLGIVWYLVPDESRGSDGKHIGYLKPTRRNQTRFKACDPGLYQALSRVVTKRSISGIERSGVLPEETKYFSNELTFQSCDSSPAHPIGMRKQIR